VKKGESENKYKRSTKEMNKKGKCVKEKNEGTLLREG